MDGWDDGAMTWAQQIGSLEELREHYRNPAPRSLEKEVDHLDVHCRDFIAHAPFVVLATVNGDGRGRHLTEGGAARVRRRARRPHPGPT